VYVQHAIWPLLLLSPAVRISLEPEVFEKVTENFGDIDGVHIIFDDLIIAAVNDDDHDRIICTPLQRARAKEVKFNRSKLQLKVKQARYCGHLLTPNGVQADQTRSTPFRICLLQLTRRDSPNPCAHCRKLVLSGRGLLYTSKCSR